jgi:hypothetical protein
MDHIYHNMVNHVVDREIRTIRDGVGQNYYDMSNERQVDVVVNYYNIITHDSLALNNTI